MWAQGALVQGALVQGAVALAALLATGGHHVALAQQQTTQQVPVPVGSASSQSFDSRWTLKYDSQINYYTASMSNGIDTRQVQIPVGVTLSGRPNELWKFDVGMRTGYIDVQQTTPTGTFRLYGMTDTTVTSTTTYYGFSAFQPFLSFNASLPTGQTRSTLTMNNAKPDPDVFQTTSTGEGLNYGPTMGVNIPLSQTTVLSLGVGHTVRGAFTRDGIGGVPMPGVPGSGPTANVNPGDVTTANASIGYRSGPLALMLQGNYSWETTTVMDGIDYFRSGDRFTIAGAIGYAWSHELSSRFNASYTHYAKNHTFVLPPIPAVYGLEPSNSNNDIVNLSVDTTYKWGALSIGPSVAFMYRAQNGYDPTMLQFVPAKRMWTVSGVAQYAVNSHLTLIGRVQRMWANVDAVPQKQDPLAPGFPLAGSVPIPEVQTNAWMLSFGATAQF